MPPHGELSQASRGLNQAQVCDKVASMWSLDSSHGSWVRSAYGALFTTSMSGVAVTRVAFGDRDAVVRMTRSWSRHLARALGVQVEVEGSGHLDGGGAYVVLANHQSLIDIVALYEALPMQLGFLAKHELQKVPLFGRALELGGHVLVDRSTRKKAVQAIHSAAARVREDGCSLVIFPEGTRSDGDRVGPFKHGAFRVAKLAEVPLVPVGIAGTAKVLPKHQRKVRPGTVHVRVGRPLPAAVVQSTPVARLAELVRTQVADLAQLPLGTRL